MRRRPSRAWTVVLAALSVLWSFALLPPQMVVWAGSGTPGWLLALDRLPGYDATRALLAGAGIADDYLVFGSAVALSFVLLWLATGPAFAALGWSGRTLGALVLAGAPITVLSYLNHPVDAPLHAIWGAEAFALLAIGLVAVVAAIAAPRGRGIPLWERLLVGSTLLVMVGATLALGYWPHGTLVGFGAEAIALAAFAPRWAGAPGRVGAPARDGAAAPLAEPGAPTADEAARMPATDDDGPHETSRAGRR
ncbi:hypothetical protein ACDF64_15360 [Agromyces sp. MMS24-JH15]|uniref:hypothetical protein n=1 Tax=Agromyces sp. MMS24-JH15 TaxID=3243765 RepID=UPI00374A4AD2